MKARRVVAVLAVNLVLLCALTAGFEIGLRMRARRLPIDRRHRGILYTWGHRVVPNRFGCRERNFAVPKPPGAYRIMVLGDSLTWGAGLAEKQRYSNLLEEYLRRDFPRAGIEVLNFGFSGGPTVRERDVLKRYIDRVEPDLIIVGFCLNDTQPRGQNYSAERERYAGLFTRVAGLERIGLVHVSKFLLQRLDNLLVARGLIPDWQEALQRTYETDSREWNDFLDALGEMKDLSDSRGLPPPIFASLNQGTSSTGPTDYVHPDDTLKVYLKWYHQAEEAARDKGFTAINFEEEFREELADEILAVNIEDGHPSAACNRVYAQKLRQVVSPIIASREKDSYAGAPRKR